MEYLKVTLSPVVYFSLKLIATYSPLYFLIWAILSVKAVGFVNFALGVPIRTQVRGPPVIESNTFHVIS